MLIQPSLDSVNIGATSPQSAKIEAFARSKHDPKAGKRGGDAWSTGAWRRTSSLSSLAQILHKQIVDTSCKEIST